MFARPLTFIAALAAVFILLVPATARAASADDWRADIDQMVDAVRAGHPDPFTKTGELTWLRHVAALKRDLPNLSEEQRMVALMRLMAQLGDGHSQVEPRNAAFAEWYPVRLYQFSDGYFVTSAHRSVADLAGAQVLEIGGRPVAEAAEAARDLMGADNPMGRMENLAALHNAALMRGLGFAGADRSLRVKLRLATGRVVERTLPALHTQSPRFDPDYAGFDWRFSAETAGTPIGGWEDWTSAYRGLAAQAFRTPDPARPAHLILRRALVARAYPEHDAYYIQANVVGNAADETFDAFFDRALREIEAQKPRRVVVDLRYNFGGDGSRVPPLMRKLGAAAQAGRWRELYLLTGRKTFSAAVMMGEAIMGGTDLTVVGEPMGAPFASYGDAVQTPLARVGALMSVSSKRHELRGSGDLAEYTPVDAPAPFSFADWSQGRDPAVDPILRGEEMRAIGVIARRDGGAAARRAWLSRKDAYGRFPWWTPPTEIDLRVATDELVAAGRMQEALDTALLNAEINPLIWNTWYNLGQVQRRMGLQAASKRSFTRVLELDPKNFNAEQIRGFLAEPDQAAAPANFARPAQIVWGATVAATERALDGLCATRRTRRIDPPFLDGVKDRQMQIDCDGFAFQGAGRHAEFVFRDDRLEMVWIMHQATEDAPMEQAMTAALGQPNRRGTLYVQYPAAGAALRLDKHEVLFYAPTLTQVENWFREADASR